MTHFNHFLVASLLLFCSCGVFLQDRATKNFKDPVTKTAYYKSLNRYQQDFFYLKTICDKYFPKADNFFPSDDRIKKEQEILTKLDKNEITDWEFRLHLKSYLSHFNNQHTHVGLKGLSVTGIYPFIPFHTDSSWYILNLTKNHDFSLTGKKIIAFNDVKISEYEKKLFEFVSAENETSKRERILFWWNRPTLHEFIHGHKMDSVKLTFETGQHLWLKKVTGQKLSWQRNEQAFGGHPITRYRDRMYDYQIIDSLKLTYLQLHECYDKIEIMEGIKSYVKPWLRPMANRYVNKQISKKKPSKKLKNYFDSERPVFHEYVSKMIEESNHAGSTKLIIDLRNNNGGSELICLQLLYHLTENENLKDFSVYVKNGDFYKHYFEKDYALKMDFYRKQNGKEPVQDSLFFGGFSNSEQSLFDKITNPESPYYIPKDRPVFKGRIAIIADYSTHSAGALFTALLQDNKIGSVIGTEVSNNPTGPTTWTPFKLPHSKIEASISTHLLVRPDSKKSTQFIPDIKMEKSVDDIINGKDPLFEKALEIIRKE